LHSTSPPSIDIHFQRLSSETAVLLPSFPSTITGLRKTPGLEKWWSHAKRQAFSTWPYLLNSPTGIFLVTKTIRTQRYALCISKGTPGQISQIRIQGDISIPQNTKQMALPAARTQWIPLRNEFDFESADSGKKDPYTVLIEREASRMFILTDSNLRDSAIKLWRYGPCEFVDLVPSDTSASCARSAGICVNEIGRRQPSAGSSTHPAGIPPWVEPLPATQDPFSPDLSNYWQASTWNIPGVQGAPGPFAKEAELASTPLTSSSKHPVWSTLFGSMGQPPPIARPPTPVLGDPKTRKEPVFDGQDTLILGDGWSLIRGEHVFFLELAGNGLDIPVSQISSFPLNAADRRRPEPPEGSEMLQRGPSVVEFQFFGTTTPGSFNPFIRHPLDGPELAPQPFSHHGHWFTYVIPFRLW